MMSDMFWVLVWLMVSLPAVVYFSVKLGTYAFFRGRQVFYMHNQEKRDGVNKKKA